MDAFDNGRATKVDSNSPISKLVLRVCVGDTGWVTFPTNCGDWGIASHFGGTSKPTQEEVRAGCWWVEPFCGGTDNVTSIYVGVPKSMGV